MLSEHNASEEQATTSNKLIEELKTGFESGNENIPLSLGHDIIVIGTSSGGLEALRTLVGKLPADLGAAVFIVMHTAPQSPRLLDTILSSNSLLPCSYPRDNEPIKLGHIYLAPPDNHMLVEPGIIRIVKGPQENRHRPAVDPLFRSAARHYGPRVTGVILTGMLDDGVYGLVVIKRRGGLAVVQDPADALYPDMPQNALKKVKNVDYKLPIGEIAGVLGTLVHEAPLTPPLPSLPRSRGVKEQTNVADNETNSYFDREPEFEPVQKPDQNHELLKIEDDFALGSIPDFEILQKVGKPATIACPDCHGTLWEFNDEETGVLRFRCRVGHAYTALSLMSEHDESLQTALWVALRTLEESASLNRRLADRAQSDKHLLSASDFMESAAVAEQQAALIKRVLFLEKGSDPNGSSEKPE